MKQSLTHFDVIVVGGGHAGIEAAYAASMMGCSTALLTMNAGSIGRMSCNPAIGGTAKGHLVKEIDALGGVMGVLADKSGIQFKMLNSSKGPAVWSPRCQNDREWYAFAAHELLRVQPNLTIIEDTLEEVLLENGSVSAIRTSLGNTIATKSLVVCSGTFLNAVMHTGLENKTGGRYEEPASNSLSDFFKAKGFETGRLKTGTPPRVALDSIDLSATELNPGDPDPKPFSRKTKSVKNYIDCYITHTNERTHAELEKGFDRSPMFTGRVTAPGPRYCPSIEDKIVRFSDKPSHHLFLEPEGLNSNVVYVNGYSTSLPAEVQLAGLRTVPGLEQVKMIRPGYAVEYDFFPSHQLTLSLESKHIPGIFFAGQVNGTSGYEEAAAQGLMAGINAALRVQQQAPFVLRRSEAYIGVMIDDLIAKSTNEPYRIFTSLAEHRLVLRQDNADIRLMHYGHKFGLVTNTEYLQLQDKIHRIAQAKHIAATHDVQPTEVNDYLIGVGEPPITHREKLHSILRKQSVNAPSMMDLLPSAIPHGMSPRLKQEVWNQVEIDLKYEGYFKTQLQLIERFHRLEDVVIPESFDYDRIRALSSESRQKLTRIRPASLGQASRIAGVSPADVSVLMIFLRQ